MLASTPEDSQDAATISARDDAQGTQGTDPATRSLHDELARRIRSLGSAANLHGPFRDPEAAAAAALSAAATEAAGLVPDPAAEAQPEPWGMDSLVRQVTGLMPAWLTPKVRGLVLLNLLVRARRPQP